MQIKTWYDQYGMKRCDTTVRKPLPPARSSIRFGNVRMLISPSGCSGFIVHPGYTHMNKQGY